MIQCLCFPEIYDIKFDFALPTIFNSEVEPLKMSSSIGVDSKIEVIFILTHFYDCIEISALEIALKKKFSIFLNGRIHAFENACVFGFEVGMELSKIGCHMLKVGVDGALILEGICSFHFLVHFEAAGEPVPCIRCNIPKYITLSLCLEPKDVSSSTISSSSAESKLNGMGPRILFFGLHPVIMSASSEYCLLEI